MLAVKTTLWKWHMGGIFQAGQFQCRCTLLMSRCCMTLYGSSTSCLVWPSDFSISRVKETDECLKIKNQHVKKIKIVSEPDVMDLSDVEFLERKRFELLCGVDAFEENQRYMQVGHVCWVPLEVGWY